MRQCDRASAANKKGVSPIKLRLNASDLPKVLAAETSDRLVRRGQLLKFVRVSSCQVPNFQVEQCRQCIAQLISDVGDIPSFLLGIAH